MENDEKIADLETALGESKKALERFEKLSVEESRKVHKTLEHQSEDIVALDGRINSWKAEIRKTVSDIDFLRHTGCIKGFSEVENCVENVIKSRNYINKFWALKTVIEVKHFLLCHSSFLEKFNFNYSFQGPEFANRLFTFYYIFNMVFYFKKPFYAPCA